MIRFGINFDYKVGNRYAWLYCVATVFFASIILTTSFHTYSYFLDSFNALKVIEYFGTGLYQNQMIAAPFLTYMYLMRNLRKRYAALNELLRHVLHFD